MRVAGFKGFWEVSANFFKPPRQAQDVDYSTWLRIRFVHFYLVASLIIMSGIVLILAVLNRIPGASEIALTPPVVLSLGGLIFLYAAGIYILKRGYFRIISHTILILAFSAVWLIIFFDSNGELARLDNIMYMLVLLSTAPILMAYQSLAILTYALLNLIIAVAFGFYYFGADQVLNEYLLDSATSIVLVGIIAYYNSTINRTALEKALLDVQARKQAEDSLLRSERKYREITEMLPQTIFETDVQGRLVYVNRTGLERFGYNLEDLEKGVNIFETLDPSEHERAKTNIGRIMQGEVLSGNLYKVVCKNGESFDAEIYTRLVLENEKPVGLRGLIIDISDRLKTGKELQESRDRYQSLVNNIPGITYRCLFDKDWTMLFMSSEIDRLSGYPSSDFINNRVRTYESVIHPDDRVYTTREVSNAIHEREPWEIEYRILHRSGSIRWAYEKGQAILNTAGEVEYLDGVILDITRRKIAEQALTHSESRYRHLFLNAPVALAEVNAEGIVMGLNNRFTSLLGYQEADIPTMDHWWSKAYPDENYRMEVQAIWNRMLQGALDSRGEVKPMEFRVTGKDGSDLFVLIGASLHNGITLASFVDITGRKIAERALFESEERYRSLIEAFPDIIMISDYKGNVVFGNRKLETITGLTPDDYANPSRKAHIHPDDSEMVRSALYELIQGTETSTDQIENRFVDVWGQIHYLSGIMSKITWQGQPMIQTVSRDITEKKMIEHELEKYRSHLESLVAERTGELAVKNEELIATNDELHLLNEELLKKNLIINEQNEKLKSTLEHLKSTQLQLVQSEKMASLGVLTAGIAHEINNPLNFIQGGYEGLSDYLTERKLNEEEKVGILLTSIRTGVERATAIVRSLNQFSRSRESYDETCDIHAIMDNCLLMLNYNLRDRIRVEKLYERTPFTLPGNSGKLHQAFLNVINNAGQAIIGEGKIKIRTTLRSNEVLISISDSGHGISKEHIERVLDPFFTTKEPGQGTGLGLSITYSIISEHGGKLTIDSAEGRGTTVNMLLPLKQ
jgi:PAS domain S-box-containing protein